MKKQTIIKAIMGISLSVLFPLTILAQSVSVSFTAQDAANHHVELNRIIITNLTKNWQDTLYWPDTSLTMYNGTGIENIEVVSPSISLKVIPNPFNTATDAYVILSEEGLLTMEISDMYGHLIQSNPYSLEPGIHQFKVGLAAAGTYIMTARQNGKATSIKMICNEVGESDNILYQGVTETPNYENSLTTTKSHTRGFTSKPFDYGDMMEYVGYAIINDTEEESQRITQPQYSGETIILQFAVIQILPPTVTTDAVSGIDYYSATCGGNVISDGGAPVTERGVCVSTSHYPTILFSDITTNDGAGTGTFTSSLTGLTAGTTYYVRAYATNSAGTLYGNEVTFTTTAIVDGQPCPHLPIVTDFDNNTYNTVQIGNQCWMKENLRTRHYANGDSIPLGTSTTSSSTAYVYYPNNDSTNVATYGYLYNWPAVMNGASSSNANPSGIIGVCPTGWHVPSDAEWTQLTDYVSSKSQYVCNNHTEYIAKALSTPTGWQSCSSDCAIGGWYMSSNNATGFSVVPSGYFGGFWSYTLFGQNGYFWSSTEANSTYAYNRSFYYNYAEVFRYSYEKYFSYPVRCVLE